MDNNLPEGYRSCHLLPAYEQGAVDTINAAYRQMNGGNMATREEMLVDWDSDDFNRETDTRIVIAPNGNVAGYIDVWDLNATHVRWISQGFVHPECMGRGIGAYLLRWSIQRAQENVSKAPDGTRVVLQQFVNSTNQEAYHLLTQNGFDIVRRSYRMRIDLDQPPAAPLIPEGITIRPVQPDEVRDVLWADYEAFQDHWGAVEEPFEEFYKRWIYFMEHDPNYDPAFWFVAKDGDETAGISLCYEKLEEVPGMGWVGSLAVRSPWRKRGLGLALLQYSFGMFYRLGKSSAGLGVDAENLTGALRLYKKAGMHPWRENCTYEYELRPGIDLMKHAL